MFFPDKRKLILTLGFLNTDIVTNLLNILSPTIGFESGYLRKIPYIEASDITGEIVQYNISSSKEDWDSYETSWDFKRNPLI